MAAIVCRNVSDLCQNPFCLVVTATSFINIAPIVVGLQSLSTSASCKGSLFCTVSMLFAMVHIGASFYVASMISNRNSRRLAGQSTAASRFTWLLCHDPWVAAYIIVLILFFAWLWVGLTWRLDDEVHDGNYCPNHVGSWVNTCIACGFSFFTALFWSLVASFCVACCCDSKDYSAPYPHTEQHHQVGGGGGGSGGAYVQYEETPSSKYGSTGGSAAAAGAAAGAAAVAAPSAPPLEASNASAPAYDPKIPTAVATPILDNAKPL